MSKYLIQTTEVYRCDTENEAKQLIEDSKKASEYELKKYVSQKKYRKQKGEIVDEWTSVSLTKTFTDEKEPITQTYIEYNNGEESAF